jgi:hypothetical protein
MNVYHLGILDDEQLIIRRSYSLDDETTANAATMFKTTQVQQLLQSPEPGVVLVNGCTDRSQSTRISSITSVCATLTHALRRSAGNNVVLAFFCGQHSASTDDLAGPQGLMRSLVAFLVLSLVQNGFISEFEPIWIVDFEGDFDNLSFKDICQLFCHLIKLVPKEVRVYCIIDGISYYERENWKQNYNQMMECLDSIIRNPDVITAFKLLLTSPTVSRWLTDLPPHQQVSLRNTRMRGAVNAESYVQSIVKGI